MEDFSSEQSDPDDVGGSFAVQLEKYLQFMAPKMHDIIAHNLFTQHMALLNPVFPPSADKTNQVETTEKPNHHILTFGFSIL